MKKIFTLQFLLYSLFTNAQFWNYNTIQNNPVAITNNITTKQNMATITDSSGGMWIVWEDARNTTTTGTDIYAQKLKSDGSIAFDGAGIVVCNAIGNQTAIAITDDGVGGCVLSWTDTRATNNDIYAQHISSNGTMLWTINGVPVSNATGSELVSVIERVNSTEVMVGWRDDRNNTLFSTGQDYFINKLLLTNGSKQWTNDFELVRGNNTQSNLRLLRNGNGGAFAVWQDPRLATTNADIYLQIVTNTGTNTLTANGLNLTAAALFNQSNVQIISDGSGGAVIVWDDNRTANADQDIYAQRVNSSGAIQWAANGVAISAVASSNQRNPFITKDGSGGAIITWQDTRNTVLNGNDIYAQKINGNGVIQWATNGVAICLSSGSQPNSTSGFGIKSDTANGAYIYWDDARISTSDIDVYVQKIDSSGVVAFATNGAAVANRTGSNQRLPQAVTDSIGRLLIAWQDGRTNSNTELYASRVENTGVLPLTLVAIKAYINNGNGYINWQTANEYNVAKYIIEKSSNGINFIEVGDLLARNGVQNSYLYTDNKLQKGKSYYRVRGVDKDGSITYSSVVWLQHMPNNQIDVQVYPNPVVNSLFVKITNASIGAYTAKIVDISGNIVQLQPFNIAAAFTNIAINTDKLPKGTYVLQITNGENASLTNLRFVK